MASWFNRQSRLIQVLLLLIPVVNWFVEIIVRWSAFFQTKKILTLVAAVLGTIGGFALGWIDVVWCLLFKHLIFAKA